MGFSLTDYIKEKRGEAGKGFSLSEYIAKKEKPDYAAMDKKYASWVREVGDVTRQIGGAVAQRQGSFQDSDTLASYSKGVSGKLAELRNTAGELRSFYSKNAGAYDTAEAGKSKQLLDSISYGRLMLQSAGKALSDEKSYWSNWKDSADYEGYKTAMKEYDRLRSLDPEKEREKYRVDEKELGALRGRQNVLLKANATNTSEYKDLSKRLSALEEKAAQKDKIEADIRKSELIKKGDTYDALRQNKDFAALSGYDDTSTDDLYRYINGDVGAGKRLGAVQSVWEKGTQSPGAALWAYAHTEQEAGELSDRERSIYNYIAATQGLDKAHEYYDYLKETSVGERRRAALRDEMEGFTEKHPILGSAVSLAYAPLRGVSYIEQLADYADDGALRQNAPYNAASYIVSDIRSKAAQGIKESLKPKFGENAADIVAKGYLLGMSYLDSRVNSAVVMGADPGVSQKVLEGVSLLTMGSGAAADAVLEAEARGLDDGQAVLIGSIAGLAEIMTEKISLESLLDADLLKDSLWKYVGKNMLSEGSEEAASNLINYVSDILVAGDKSEAIEAYKLYKAEGLDDAVAFAMVVRDEALSLGVDFIGGALMGGVGGGTVAIGNTIGNARTGRKLGSLEMSAEDKQSFIEEGLASAPDTRAHQIAEELQAKRARGEEISDFDLGRQYNANVMAVEEEKNTGSSKKIVDYNTLLSESEKDKADRLSGAAIIITDADKAEDEGFKPVKGIRLNIAETKKILLPILEKLGIVPNRYSNTALDISFEYSKSGAGRSIAHQFGETDGDFSDFSTVQSNLEKLCENAYPLEAHYDEKPKKADNHVTGVVTFGSVLRSESGIIPVRMTVKFYDNSDPRLHVVINQSVKENGSAFIHDEWTQDVHNSTESASAIISVSDFLRLVNESAEFNKRIPDEVLGAEESDKVPETINTNVDYAPINQTNNAFNSQNESNIINNGGNENGTAEERTDLSDGEPDGRDGIGAGVQTWGVAQNVRNAGGDRQHRNAVYDRREVTLPRETHPYVSSADEGIANGTDRTSLQRYSENEWDDEAKAAAEFAYSKGVKNVRFYVGDMVVSKDGFTSKIHGYYDPGSSTLYAVADSDSRSLSEIVEHEVAHSIVTEEKLNEFIEVLAKAKASVANDLLQKYARYYNQLTNNFEGYSDTEKTRYLAEEILADAYARTNKFGTRAGAFAQQAADILERAAGEGAGEKREGKYSTKEDALNLEGVDWMDNYSSIKEQLSKHQSEINAMTPVAEVEYNPKSAKNLVDVILNEVSKVGGSYMKRGTIGFEFDRAGAGKINAHARSDELRAAAMVSPYVAKYGKLIAGQKNHEGTGVTTLTFAAPAILNGDITNVGVAVQFDKESRPRAVNVELQNGDKFKLDMTKAPSGHNSRVHRVGEGTALSTKDASIDIISDDKPGVKGKFSASEEQWELVNDFEAEKDRLRDEINVRGSRDYQNELLRSGGVEAFRDNEKRRSKAIKEYAELSGTTTAAEKRARIKADKPVAQSKPIISKRDLRRSLLGQFSAPEGLKKELGAAIDGLADRMIREGRVSERDRKELFDRLYSAGVVTQQADDYLREARQLVLGRRIYVSNSIRAEFGDDWGVFSRRAWGAGVYFTSDTSALSLDRVHQELGYSMPSMFSDEEYDMRTVLENIVRVAEEGKDQHLSLDEYVNMLANENYVSRDEVLDNIEREYDQALRTFAEKAGLEIYLRDRTGKKIAEERNKSAQERQKEQKRREREKEARREAEKKARENKELRELQQSTLKQLQWLSRNQRRAPEELRAQWNEVLSGIDVFAVNAANELHWDKKREATWRDLAEMYKTAKDTDPNFLPSKEMERIVARIDYDHIGDMDIDALRNLYKAAVGIRTEFYNRNNIINDEQQRMFADVYESVKGEITEAGEGSQTNSAKWIAGMVMNDAQLTPMNRFQRMAGWNPGSTWLSMARQLEEGEREARRFEVDSKHFLDEFVSSHQDWLARADGQGKNAIWYQLEIPEFMKWGEGDKPIFGDTVKVYMTPLQKVHMALEAKNYENLYHMLGGRTFADRDLYAKGERDEAFAHGTTIKMAPETVQKIVSDLTEEERELASLLERYYNTFAKEKINEKSNILYGYDKAMGSNYAPIFTNKNYTKTEPGVFDVTAEGVGNLKERKHGMNPCYNISAIDAFNRSVNQTKRFVGYAIPIRNMTTLMNWREKGNSMMDIISHSWDKKTVDWINDLMTELQGGKTSEQNVIDELANKALSAYISSVFGLNPSIVLKQFASFPLAAAYLGTENAPNIVTAQNVSDELINAYTGELAYRLLGYSSPETAQLVDNPTILQKNGPLNFIFGGGAITWMDGFTVKSMWSWAENKVRRENDQRAEENKLSMGSEQDVREGRSEFYKEVAKVFEEAVSRSQPMYDVMHRSEIMRNGKGIARAFTLFKTVPQQEYNMIRQAFGEASYYKKINAPEETQRAANRKAGGAILSIITGNVMLGAITFLNALWKNKGKKYRDDDGELTVGSIAAQYLKQFISDSAGVALMGDTLSDVLFTALSGNKWHDIETPGVEQINDIISIFVDGFAGICKLCGESAEVLKNGGDWGQYMAEHGDMFVSAIDQTIRTFGTYSAGLPLDNLKAYLLGSLQWVAPAVKTAYDDAMKHADKDGLKGLKGASLEIRTEHILQDRARKVGNEAVKQIASLYAAGYKEAVPADVPASISVNTESRKLGIVQQQIYKNTWKKAVEGALDELVDSDSYREADEETRAKMVKALYDYGANKAKEVLFDDFVPERAQVIANDIIGGETTAADWASWKGNVATLEPESGKKSVSDAQKWEAVFDRRDSTSKQMNALRTVMSDSQYSKLETSVTFGVPPEAWVWLKTSLAEFDEDESGKLSNKEAESAIDELGDYNHPIGAYVDHPLLSLRQQAALWQLWTGSKSAKSNPFDPRVGQEVLDAIGNSEVEE